MENGSNINCLKSSENPGKLLWNGTHIDLQLIDHFQDFINPNYNLCGLQCTKQLGGQSDIHTYTSLMLPWLKWMHLQGPMWQRHLSGLLKCCLLNYCIFVSSMHSKPEYIVALLLNWNQDGSKKKKAQKRHT